MLLDVSIIDEILNNRLSTIIGISVSTIILTAVGNYGLNKLMAVLDKKIQTPTPLGQEYFNVRMWRLINNKIPKATIVTDRWGKILWVNNKVTALLHWQRSEMLGHNLDMIIPERSRDMHNEAMEEYRRTGFGKVFGKPLMLSCLTKGNIEIPVEITIDEAVDDEDDTVFIIGQIRDMRNQLEETKAMRQKIARYERQERMTSSGSFDWDFQDDVVDMSPGMLFLFDMDESDNHCPSSVTTGKLDAEYIDKVADVITSAIQGKKGGYEMSFKLKNGRYLYCSAEIDRNKNENPTIIHGAVTEIKTGV